LTPRNVGSDHTLNWVVTTDAPWMQVTPQRGVTPQSFTVTPIDLSTLSIFLYTGALTVTVESPESVAGSPHRIQVALNVVDMELEQVYLPAVFRNF